MRPCSQTDSSSSTGKALVFGKTAGYRFATVVESHPRNSRAVSTRRSVRVPPPVGALCRIAMSLVGAANTTDAPLEWCGVS